MLPSCKQPIDRAVFASLRSTVIKKNTEGHEASRPQPVGSHGTPNVTKAGHSLERPGKLRSLEHPRRLKARARARP